ITVKLQSRAIDIVDAYNNIDKILSLYKQLRSNINSTFDIIYKHAERMAASVNVQPSQQRICRQQIDRPNAATNASTIEEWYQINAAIPFLDYIISDLSFRFSLMAKRSSTLLCLVPSVLSTNEIVSFSEILDTYSDNVVDKF
uniref:HAT C-terminal dimerisation domain-containing protein n=1 Tax=Amphimedon queenslandica TaxID=400682 RepID=A0A1X7VHL2_AMPQE